jgi:hypothetical protein
MLRLRGHRDGHGHCVGTDCGGGALRRADRRSARRHALRRGGCGEGPNCRAEQTEHTHSEPPGQCRASAGPVPSRASAGVWLGSGKRRRHTYRSAASAMGTPSFAQHSRSRRSASKSAALPYLPCDNRSIRALLVVVRALIVVVSSRDGANRKGGADNANNGSSSEALPCTATTPHRPYGLGQVRDRVRQDGDNIVVRGNSRRRCCLRNRRARTY